MRLKLKIVPFTFLAVTLLSEILFVDAQKPSSNGSSLPTSALLLYFSEEEIESLRKDIRITTDPECIEAIQDSLINFLKEIRQSNGIRIPRQDDGDEDGDDGDGAVAGAVNGLFGGTGGGGAGGILSNVSPVVPQVLGAITQAFSGFNQVVNQTTGGQGGIPTLFLNGFQSLVGQFTGVGGSGSSSAIRPVTPPPYFQLPPVRPQASGYPASQRPPYVRPSPQTLKPRYTSTSTTEKEPDEQVATQTQPQTEPPKKSSLWSIYKSTMPVSGAANLTDFQVAHPEGFHSELLQSISNSLNKNRRTTERTVANSNLPESSADIQPGFNPNLLINQVNHNSIQQQKPPLTSENPNFQEISTEIPLKQVTSTVPPKIVFQPKPSEKPSGLHFEKVGASNSDSPLSEIAVQTLIKNKPKDPPKVLVNYPTPSDSNLIIGEQQQPEVDEPQNLPISPSKINQVNSATFSEETTRSHEFVGITEELKVPSPPAEEVTASIFPPQPSFAEYFNQDHFPSSPTEVHNVQQKTKPPRTVKPFLIQNRQSTPPNIDEYDEHVQQNRQKPTTEKQPFVQKTKQTLRPSSQKPLVNKNRHRTSTQKPLSNKIILPHSPYFEHPFLQLMRRTTTSSPSTKKPYEKKTRKPIFPSSDKLVTESIVTINRPGWNGDNENIKISTLTTEASSRRPVIVNNMYYPDLESALASSGRSTTEKPKRRRRKTTTLTPEIQESDYYEDDSLL